MRGSCTSLLLALLTLLTSATAALGAPVYRDPLTYRGVTKAPALKPAIAPPSVSLSPKGTFPDALIDEAGTAHVVWNDGRGDQDDAAMYCRLKRGATACEGGPVALTWNKTYGDGDGPQFNIDNFGPKIIRLGQQLVIFSKRYPTNADKPDGASSRTVVAWTSANGGQSWTDAQIVGKNNIEALTLVGPPGDQTVLALGQDPLCPGMCVTNYESGAYAANSGDLATGPDQSYEASLANDAAGRPVAAFQDLAGNVITRRWTGNGSPRDPAQWTAPATPFPGVELALAGGPAGLFLMSKPGFGRDYELRKLDPLSSAAPPGPPTTISSGNDPVLEDLAQDASGRVMTAWTQRGGDAPGVQLRTSRPLSPAEAAAPGVPSLNPAETIIAGAGAGQTKVVAAPDGGGFVIANRTGGINSEGEIVAGAFGTVAANGQPGIGGIQGGAGQTNQCGVVKFGAIKVESDGGGCFFVGQGANATKYVTRGAIDLFGVKIVPDAGVRLVFDPKALTIDAVEGSAQVRVIVSSPLTGDITLWHGTFHRDLSKLVPGSELFSFDSSAYLAKILGFDISKNISVRLNKKGDGIEIPISLKLPAGFGGASADATLTATRATGLEIGSLHLHLGPVTIGIATLDRFDLVYQGADQLWSGEGVITFAGFGTIGAKAEFAMGNFKEAHVSFEPAAPPLIGPFVYLLRADVGFGVNPLFVELGGQIGGGAAVAGEAPVKFDGSARVTIPANGPADLRGTGKLSAALIRVATATLRYQTDGYLDFNAQLDQDLTVLSLKAAMDGFVDAGSGQWGASLEGEICLALDIGCLKEELAASSSGLAVCGRLFGGSAGLRLTWKEIEELTESYVSTLVVPIVGQVKAAALLVDALAIPCSTAGFKVPPPRAAAAQAGGGQRVAIRSGLPTATIAVLGEGGLPQVDLSGPGGTRIAGPAAGGQPVSTSAGSAIAIPQANAIVFVINGPRAGDWTITPRAGSPPIASLRQSDGYRAATAKASLGGKGRARTLSYRVSDLGSGQSVDFIERSRHGTRRIGAAKKASGTFKISPTLQPGGQRTIYAQVRRDGIVTSRRVVVRYRAAGPPAVGAVKSLKVRRAGRIVTVTWKGAANAARYQVKLTGKNISQVKVLGARLRTARFDSIAQTARVTAEVRGLAKTGRQGAARKVVAAK